jgi:hypothetical protein
LRQSLVDRIDGQQPCFEAFLSLAAPDVSAIFARECTAGLEIEQLRRQACTRVPPQTAAKGATLVRTANPEAGTSACAGRVADQ